MTRAFEKADEHVRRQLLDAMAMPVDTDKEKEAKIIAVKNIYSDLSVGEEAREEISRLHSQAMSYVQELRLPSDAALLLENYAKKLIGRTK